MIILKSMFYTSHKSNKNKKSSSVGKIPSKTKTNIKTNNIKTNITKTVKEDGLLLIQGLDPLSELFCAITKQDYSLIGRYSTNSDNKELSEYKITEYKITELWYIFNGNKPILDFTLSDMLQSGYIGKVIKYPFRQPDNFWNSENLPIPIESLLWSLFRKELCGMTGIRRILHNLYPNRATNPPCDNYEMLLENSPIINNNSCLVISTNSKNIEIMYDRDYLVRLSNTFTDMLMNDSNFLQLVSTNDMDILDYFIIPDKERVKNFMNQQNEKESIDIMPMIINLRTELSNIVNTIKNNNVPYININSIIRITNEILKSHDLEDIPTITNPSSGLVIISDNDQSIPLTLKNGNKVLLTTNNYDLSIFTREELIEILEGIDKLVIDDRFDILRTNIVKEINTQ